uniref:RETREG1-3/ARL6IP-like N-terminal reticulon-homology domain-containing protein n=1 Tax=Timema cristinae TaxID=61476 RepID=A0A7R9CCR1_TIMCR|nr:unnamed protein product [Timema cristinae]
MNVYGTWNKQVRNSTWLNIVEVMVLEGFGTEDVKQKIKSQEKAKMKGSHRSGAGASAYQDKRVKELKRELEGWREVILPLNSVILWENNLYPGLLAGVTTALFLLFWLLDPSLLTTVSVIGLVAALVDYLVPTLTASLSHPESWTGAKERKLEDICRALAIAEHQGFSYCKTFYDMRNTRPKMYYLSVIVSLVFLAWLGNTVNNLLLTYLFGRLKIHLGGKNLSPRKRGSSLDFPVIGTLVQEFPNCGPHCRRVNKQLQEATSSLNNDAFLSAVYACPISPIVVHEGERE